MKIKLMIVSLVAVFGLQGMEYPRNSTLALALNCCTVDNRSYQYNDKAFLEQKMQRPVVVHFFDGKDEQYSSSEKIEALVAGSLKSNFVTSIAEALTIHLLSDANDDYFLRKNLSVNHKQWLEGQEDYQFCGDQRIRACLFYNLADEKSANLFVDIVETVLDINKRTPLLVNINNSVITNPLPILEQLGKDVVLRGDVPQDAQLFLDRLVAQSEKTEGSEIDNCLKQLKDLAADKDDLDDVANALPSNIDRRLSKLENSKKSKGDVNPVDGPSNIDSRLKKSEKHEQSSPEGAMLFAVMDLFANHYGKLAAGGFVAAFLAYYYKFVR